MGEASRRITPSALAILGAVALLAAVVTAYARHAVFDAEEFADRAAAALEDDAVRAEIATRVTDDLVLQAEQDLIAARPVIEGVVDGIAGGSLFQSLFKTAVRDVHRAIFQGDQNTVTLTLADIGQVLRGAVDALRPQLSEHIPGGIEIEITEVEPPPWFAELARLADDIVLLEVILLAIAVLLVGGALWLSPDRRDTTLKLGVAVVICGVAAVVALGAVRAALLVPIAEAGLRDAAAGIWEAFLGDLTKVLYLFAACGAVVAAAASSLLQPIDIFAPLRRGVSLIATQPYSRRRRVIRAVLLIVIGVLIVLNRHTFIDLVALLTGLYVAYAGVSELMRLILPTAPADAHADRAEGRRALIATGVTAGLILLAGAIFIGTGGVREAPAAIETVGCNGGEQLCERPLDQVTFPATHNAMSGATNRDWLFAQQETGLAEQLHDGIRALFIDAHYGTPTESGRVKTDLSDLDGTEREAYEDELGPEALDAALRIRDRLVDSPASGPRGVYLCHRFCELGAISIDDGFRDIRDFLAANPDEVVVIVIEDYVAPADIDAAVKRSGLIDYVYDGPLDPEALPSLQEVIDSGGRAILMAEQDAGGASIPYYHAAYDALVQETPYSFKQPELLTGEAHLDESCAPNRGPHGAPLLLLNHWVDTSPAPRPSNAAEINSPEELAARIERCEQLRGQRVNFVSVDFYREGDLFEVVRELNAEETPAAAAE